MQAPNDAHASKAGRKYVARFMGLFLLDLV
jgi:hypothetical protein